MLKTKHDELEQKYTALKQEHDALQQQHTTLEKQLSELLTTTKNKKQTQALALYRETYLDEFEQILVPFSQKELEELKELQAFDSNSMFQAIQQEIKQLSKQVFAKSTQHLHTAVQSHIEKTTLKLQGVCEEATRVRQSLQNLNANQDTVDSVVSPLNKWIVELNKQVERWKSLQKNFTDVSTLDEVKVD
ncbi:hypothetical protein RFI_07164 [Reticulomyxa filosa]|uniref:Uncharacterized protein n=1 Tax=Reticulomyxa filosa TaxID=46433 RepID=X6NVP9_RETFI|nr:hypothetical protein RFI_07164 [Reticulomyxa filosa]|eukprot:ETO29958.1 hypothetical protein RFI_07164 [Reticulomyxa filosa]